MSSKGNNQGGTGLGVVSVAMICIHPVVASVAWGALRCLKPRYGWRPSKLIGIHYYSYSGKIRNGVDGSVGWMPKVAVGFKVLAESWTAIESGSELVTTGVAMAWGRNRHAIGVLVGIFTGRPEIFLLTFCRQKRQSLYVSDYE